MGESLDVSRSSWNFVVVAQQHGNSTERCGLGRIGWLRSLVAAIAWVAWVDRGFSPQLAANGQQRQEQLPHHCL